MGSERNFSRKKYSNRIINIKQIKPFPEPEILEIIESNMMLISLEEASIINGLGTCISEIVTDNNLKNNLLRIGINDGFVKSGSKENLEKEYEIDKDSVIDQILANLEIK